MNWKEWLKGYLTFGRKDRLGVIVLLGLIVLTYALPYLAPSRVEPPLVLDDSVYTTANKPKQAPGAADADEASFDYGPAPSVGEPDFTNGELFFFDPNTLDADGWRRLGLREKTIRTILNYRSKGGKFYRREDLQKIWGLPEGFYERVENHISIPPKDAPFAERPAYTEKKSYEKRMPNPVDINTADTSAWIALPGIGSKLAGRIVNFRAKLGGFHSVEQVGTTYGLPDSTFRKIKPLLRIAETAITRININTATKEQLSAHPYIDWKLASAVVAYREQHGPYGSIADLKKIMILDEATFEQLKPYLSVQ